MGEFHAALALYCPVYMYTEAEHLRNAEANTEDVATGHGDTEPPSKTRVIQGALQLHPGPCVHGQLVVRHSTKTRHSHNPDLSQCKKM